MLTVEKIDTKDKRQVRRFIKIPFKFYTDTPQWVPPIIMDIETMLNKSKHPFYEHSDGDFYIAIRDGDDVGRIGVLRIHVLISTMTVNKHSSIFSKVKIILKQR